MPLDTLDGEKALKLITSRYNQYEWRKKIEKTLSLPPSGMGDEVQRKIFLYFKIGLQAYKSRRADPPSWIVGGFATKEVIERARFNPGVIDQAMTQEHVAMLGMDPGDDVDEVWWEEMLVKWFEEPEELPEEEAFENTDTDGSEKVSESSSPK
jgi:hypothetical protein